MKHTGVLFQSDYRAVFQYRKNRLIPRSRQVSKPRDSYLELSYRSESLQAPAKFQSDTKGLTLNLVASRLDEILG